MSKVEEIRAALAGHAKKYGPMATMLATVKNVDKSAGTCTLEDDDQLEYADVRLRPVLDGTESMTLFPKLGTWVLAVRIEESEDWMVIAAGEFNGWRLKIGTRVIELDGSGLDISNGSDSLKDLLTLVIQAVQVIVVAAGNPPDYQKLIQATLKLNNIFK